MAKINIKSLIEEINQTLSVEAKFVRSEDPEMTDDEIVVTKDISIQVCEDGEMGVTKSTSDNDFECYPYRNSKAKIIEDLKKAMA